jgi:hypothetical protein
MLDGVRAGARRLDIPVGKGSVFRCVKVWKLE